MTKRQLIEILEEMNVPDDTEFKIRVYGRDSEGAVDKTKFVEAPIETVGFIEYVFMSGDNTKLGANVCTLED